MHNLIIQMHCSSSVKRKQQAGKPLSSTYTSVTTQNKEQENSVC